MTPASFPPDRNEVIGISLNFVPRGYHLLEDRSSTGRKKSWDLLKQNTELVSESMNRIGLHKKAMQMLSCGSFLAFKKFHDETLKLHNANFCRLRLCPLCAWRRSLKVFTQLEKIMEVATKEDKYEYLFLTLTIRNCPADELSETISTMIKGYDALFKKRNIAKVYKGAFRSLEVTYNKKTKEFHPHFHVVLMVEKKYLSRNEGYISQKKLVKIWRDCLKVDYDPILDIRKIKSSDLNIKKAVAEVAKYTVKSKDILLPDQDETDQVVMALDSALAGRRLISYRGHFKEIYDQLKLDDPVDGDLIHIGEDIEQEQLYDVVYYCYHYGWHHYFETDRNRNFIVKDRGGGFEEISSTNYGTYT